MNNRLLALALAVLPVAARAEERIAILPVGGKVARPLKKTLQATLISAAQVTLDFDVVDPAALLGALPPPKKKAMMRCQKGPCIATAAEAANAKYVLITQAKGPKKKATVTITVHDAAGEIVTQRTATLPLVLPELGDGLALELEALEASMPGAAGKAAAATAEPAKPADPAPESVAVGAAGAEPQHAPGQQTAGAETSGGGPAAGATDPATTAAGATEPAATAAGATEPAATTAGATELAATAAGATEPAATAAGASEAGAVAAAEIAGTALPPAETGPASEPGSGWIGVSYGAPDAEAAAAASLDPVRGVQVRAVTAGGPAAKVGLQAGDLILMWGRQVIDDPPHLKALVGKSSAGQSVLLHVWRAGQNLQLRIELTARP